MKTKVFDVLLNIVNPIALIILHGFFEFVQIIWLDIQYFGLQDPEFTEEQTAAFYKVVTPYLIICGVFLLICVFFLVLSFIKSKSQKSKLVLLILLAVGITLFVTTIIVELVFLYKIGLLVTPRADLLLNWAMWFAYGPYVLIVLLGVPLLVLRLVRIILNYRQSSLNNINKE